MNRKNRLLIFGLLFFINASAQMKQYNYAKSLSGISEEWHQIVLDDEIKGATSQNLNDLRIYGITAKFDTVEAPYLLQVLSDKVERSGVSFKQINQSSIGDTYYFTFEIPSLTPIDEIELDFEQSNFDWQIQLEGSQNQEEWFTILANYRILSIENELTDYHFTKLKFPSSKFSYFRLKLESDKKPELRSAQINSVHITKGEVTDYKINQIEIKNLKKRKQTEIDVTFDQPVRLSMVDLNVSDKFDYYRRIEIKFLSDSIKTEKGWVYNYRPLTNGILNSMESNVFKFPTTTLKEMRILIENKDNAPLNVEDIDARGFVHRLVARFSVSADYYLAYGNENSVKPNYDISRFKEKIPERMTRLTLGNEERLNTVKSKRHGPLITNNIWLWVILLPGIAVIVWFSLKMLKQQ